MNFFFDTKQADVYSDVLERSTGWLLDHDNEINFEIKCEDDFDFDNQEEPEEIYCVDSPMFNRFSVRNSREHLNMSSGGGREKGRLSVT